MPITEVSVKGLRAWVLIPAFFWRGKHLSYLVKGNRDLNTTVQHCKKQFLMTLLVVMKKPRANREMRNDQLPEA